MDNFLLIKLQQSNGYCIVHVSKCNIHHFEAKFTYKEKKCRGIIVMNGKFNILITFLIILKSNFLLDNEDEINDIVAKNKMKVLF